MSEEWLAERTQCLPLSFLCLFAFMEVTEAGACAATASFLTLFFSPFLTALSKQRLVLEALRSMTRFKGIESSMQNSCCQSALYSLHNLDWHMWSSLVGCDQLEIRLILCFKHRWTEWIRKVVLFRFFSDYLSFSWVEVPVLFVKTVHRKLHIYHFFPVA